MRICARALSWLFLLVTGCSSPEREPEKPVAAATKGYGPSGEALRPRFVDVAEAVGLLRVHTSGEAERKTCIVEAKGGGAAFLDHDGDGDLDIYWVNGATLDDPDTGGGNALYRNDGEAGFTDVGKALGVVGRGWGMGAVSADYDNDGDADLYVTNLRDNILYRNDGATGFAESGTGPGAASSRWSTGAAFGDYDRDGDVDLYVANYAELDLQEVPGQVGQWRGMEVFIGPMGLPPAADVLYRNDGGRLTDVTAEAGLDVPDAAFGLGVLFADYDADGDPDLYVANDSNPNFLYRNEGGGAFADVSLRANAAHGAMGHSQASMGLAWGDYDADGHPDIFATHFESDYNTLYRNEGNGMFAVVTAAAGLARPSFNKLGFGTGFLDYDNDGDLDLYVANGHVYPQIERAGSGTPYAQLDQLFDNRGDGRFELLAPLPGDAFGSARVSRGSLIGDYDNDGDLDIFVTNLNDRPALLRNGVGAGQNWLGVRLAGTVSNRDGIGARLRLVAGGSVQYRDVLAGSSFLSGEDRRAHFGLGQAKRVDSLQVRWPSGVRQSLVGLAVNQYVEVREAP